MIGCNQVWTTKELASTRLDLCCRFLSFYFSSLPSLQVGLIIIKIGIMIFNLNCNFYLYRQLHPLHFQLWNKLSIPAALLPLLCCSFPGISAWFSSLFVCLIEGSGFNLPKYLKYHSVWLGCNSNLPSGAYHRPYKWVNFPTISNSSSGYHTSHYTWSPT